MSFITRALLRSFHDLAWPRYFGQVLQRRGEHAVIDQEALYARVIGLLVRQRDLNFQEVLATELTAYPPSTFHADGQTRVATGKSTLKKNIQVDV